MKRLIVCFAAVLTAVGVSVATATPASALCVHARVAVNGSDVVNEDVCV